MKPSELLALLQAMYREKLALKVRHEAGAEHMPGYEFNNTYQYVINREEVHLTWLRAAIEALDGKPADAVPELSLPAAGRDEDSIKAILRDDADRATAFVERWRERVEQITHARNRGMLRVVLGEMLELRRFFEQALAGRLDLLGPRHATPGTGGGVLARRWRGD